MAWRTGRKFQWKSSRVKHWRSAVSLPSEANEEGIVKVFFEMNGQPRRVRIEDRTVAATKVRPPRAEVGNPLHVGAPMPGAVVTVAVQKGSEVRQGDVLLTIEAMKMESSIRADRDGTIDEVFVAPGSQIDAKDLLMTFSA